MDIEKFKHQHVEILDCIASLRRRVQEGIEEHAHEIADLVVSMSSVIKLHLAVEDRVLYPTLHAGSDARLARMATRFQQEMAPIARAYVGFARRWNTAESLRSDPQRFRADANVVLKTVFERMQRENAEFYPAIEAASERHPAHPAIGSGLRP